MLALMAAIRQVMVTQDFTLDEQPLDEFKAHLILDTEIIFILNRALDWDHAGYEEIYLIKLEALWIYKIFTKG